METSGYYEDVRCETIKGDLNLMRNLTFPGNNGECAVKLNFANDPPTVWVNPDLAWDVAAKQFWNAVYRCVGRPALFPESDM